METESGIYIVVNPDQKTINQIQVIFGGKIKVSPMMAKYEDGKKEYYIGFDEFEDKKKIGELFDTVSEDDVFNSAVLFRFDDIKSIDVVIDRLNELKNIKIKEDKEKV